MTRSHVFRFRVACVTTALATSLGAMAAAPSAATAFAASPTPVAAPAPSEAATPSTTQRSQRASQKKTGLRVTIQRPADAASPVTVIVKGPKQPGDKKKFKKKIRKTTTFKRLTPGRYKIRAKTADLFDQQVEPTVSKRQVRIKTNRKRKVSKVVYAPVFCSTSGTTAYGWGEGAHGRLGTTDSTDRLAPAPIARIRGLKAITGGLRSTYGLCGDGTVWSWGFNQNGELGIGRSGDRAWPVRVPGLNGVVEIAANHNSAYALKSDGTVWAWGSGRYGQLGNGQSGFGYRSTAPVRVNLSGPATAIAAGGYNAYAILDTGHVSSWGVGGVGQLGNNTSGVDAPTPVMVDTLDSAQSIAAGHSTVYVWEGGGVWAWGDGGQGQIGDGMLVNRDQPVLVALNADAIGASGAAGFTIDDGSVDSWGSGRYGDVGFDNGGSPEPTPTPNVTLTEVTRIVGGAYTGYALTATGRIWAWGDHGAGQVGNGAPKTGPSHITGGILPPTELSLTGVLAIGAGVTNGYALR